MAIATRPLKITPTGRTAALSPLRYPGGRRSWQGFSAKLLTVLESSTPRTSNHMPEGQEQESVYFARIALIGSSSTTSTLLFIPSGLRWSLTLTLLLD